MLRDIWDGFTGKVKLAERKRLNSLVIERDERLCILCGKAAADVHHIIHRSQGGKNSPIIWQEKNMCCLCFDHHVECHDERPLEMRTKLLKKMQELYQYEYLENLFQQYLLEDEE